MLFLPIAVDGELFSTGDGHAVQGDGEVAGPALNCPMQVEMGSDSIPSWVWHCPGRAKPVPG